jgi:hypothetical protein
MWVRRGEFDRLKKRVQKLEQHAAERDKIHKRRGQYLNFVVKGLVPAICAMAVAYATLVTIIK